MWTECLMATSVSTTYLFVELQSWGSKLVIVLSKIAITVAVAVANNVASSISQSILARITKYLNI